MILARAVLGAACWAAAVFYRVERAGGAMPEGPTLIVANHSNMLMDPLLALWIARRPVRVLVKAPLFRIPIFGHVARGVGALPVYRVQDDPALLARNKATFAAAIEALRAGETVLTFPEGGSQSKPSLAPLKAGTARLALTAEEKSDWALALKIVPLGLTYNRKHLFRSRVVASLGAAIPVSRWREAYMRDRVVAIRSQTDTIAAALRRQTLNLTAHSEREIVETTDLLYARSKNRMRWGERETLQARLPGLQRSAEALAWLREHDGSGYIHLTAAIRDYRRQLAELRGVDIDVPAGDRLWPSLRRLLAQGALLGLGFPLAAVGMVAWYVPYAAAGLVARLVNPERETISTVKFLTGIIAFPATYIGWLALAGWISGGAVAALAALALPPLGFLAIEWQRRRREAFEDARVLWHVVRRPQARDRLLELRDVLIGKLDAVLAESEAERGALRGRSRSRTPPPASAHPRRPS